MSSIVKLKPHQEKAVNALSSGKVLCGGVGTGKTLTALWWYLSVACGAVPGDLGAGMRYPKDLYVITTAKKRDSFDWQTECAGLGISLYRESSVNGTQVVVDSWNNLERYVGVKGAVFLFDEQRLVGSGAWTKSFLKIAKANEWILLSATPGDTWLDYIPVFVANGFYKNRTQFKLEHVVYNNYAKYPKVERYLGVSKLKAHRDAILVDMPYERHTKRHLHYVDVEFDKDLMRRVEVDRWHVFENRPLRDIGEQFIVMRKVANTDSSRIRALHQVMRSNPKVIVFYNFDYELEILRRGLSTITGRKLAEWNGHKHEPIPDSDSWVYLVQYTAGAEGWNCVETDVVVFYSLNYSYKVFEQAQGRIDRLNTPFTDLHYYILASKSRIDQYILRALKVKKNFNLGAFKRRYAW